MDADILACITAGFDTIKEMIIAVIKVGVPASIGVMAIAQGAKYGMRWVRGLISKA